MATKVWTQVVFAGQGDLYTATVDSGDSTAAITTVNAEDKFSVTITGTIGGSTVTVEGSNDGTNYGTLDNAGGSAMSYTVIGRTVFCPTPTTHIRVSCAGGAASGLVIGLFVPRKVRP